VTTTAPSPLQQLVQDQFSLDAPMTITERASLLREVIDLLADLNMVRAELEASIGADMEEDTFITKYGTLVRSYGGKRSRWDGRRLCHVVAARVSDQPVDLETGEVLPPAALAAKVTDELIEVAGLDRPSHGFRSSSIRARGLQPGDFSDYEPGNKVSVRFA
jgi:hypothetical protein